MSTTGKRLLEAAREVAAIARGDAQPAHVHVSVEIDVRAVRARLDLSQDEFASQFGFTSDQIRDWEQGRSRPLGALHAYLTIIDRDADSVRRLLNDARQAA